MSNPFALPIDWQALASLIVGMAAVIAAVFVASRQNQLRRDEIRISLLQLRREVVSKLDGFIRDWTELYSWTSEDVQKLRGLVDDIEMTFDDRITAHAQQILSGSHMAKFLEDHIKNLRDEGKWKGNEHHTEKWAAITRELANGLRELRKLLAEATRVGHIFH